MRPTILFLMISLSGFGLLGCVRQELLPGKRAVPDETFRADDALLEEGFLSGWKAIPGSYIYSGAEDELWKIYDGAAPGLVNEGGREAATQGYENTEGGADSSLRVFILRFVDRVHALAYLEKEIEGAKGGEKLPDVDAGQVFDRGKAPWARFVVGPHQVSINWEGSTDDADNATLDAVRTIAAKLPGT
ncbi:hypothetical protein HQ563_05160 [bacterium]|nr:hypothetical protein [bacterium]